MEKADKAIVLRSKISLANLFFRIEHFQENGKPLTSRQQKVVVELLIDKLKFFYIKECPFSDMTQTVIPFYDANLQPIKKKFLQRVKMSVLCQTRTASIN